MRHAHKICRRSTFGVGVVLAMLVGVPALGQDVGNEGPSYAGATAWPSQSKPESKLWYTDGQWWGCLWSAAAQAFVIHRLDTSTQTWSATAMAVDTRPQSRADCLWDGAKLYIASHYFTNGGTGADGPALLIYRFSYNPNADVYSLDTGFPVQIDDTSTETMVIDKDSDGTVWAVWMNDLRPWISHTLGDDRTWSSPIVLPSSVANVTGDDICSLVHFGGNKIGVMWSDEVSDTYRFSVHQDGAPDTTWAASEAALSGPMMSDDHINLKAASDGRVFAALKTASDQIRLAVRQTNGTWSTFLVSSAADGWTRPIILLDEEANQVHCFATRPQLGGTIYRKISSMDTISFPAGVGTVVIRDGDAPTSHNDATSTKQNLSGETGLVVVASHQPDERYWHHHDDLGGPDPAPPVAAFAVDPPSGYADLSVQFFDDSTGPPTSWAWNFGDGQNSTQRHPQHTYANPGLYTVTLMVSNSMGSDTLVRAGLIDVDPAPTMLVLEAVDDSQVREFSPNSNYGSDPTMRVRQDVNSDYHAYLKFLVPSTGNAITSATLRLFATDGSTDGGSVHPVSSSWNESLITWGNAPDLSAAALGSLGNVSTNTWVQVGVFPEVDSPGAHSFGIQNATSNSVFYSTSEGVNPPELVLTLAEPALPPVADFDVDRTSGFAPLTVQFQDSSAGAPTQWSWTFGDGGTSNVQNPSHVYAHSGSYTVSLQATNENGSDTETRFDYIHVRPHVARYNRMAVVPAVADPSADRPAEHTGPDEPLETLVRLLAQTRSSLGARIALPLALDDALLACEEELAGAGFAVSRAIGEARVTLELRFPTGRGSLELRPAGARATRLDLSWSTR